MSMRFLMATCLIVTAMGGSAFAATVIFKNAGSQNFELHVRNGPINVHPDDRGSKNTTMKVGESFTDDVGDGDVWYCYGDIQVNDADNPKLCNAKGGDTVNLDKSHNCYVDN